MTEHVAGRGEMEGGGYYSDHSQAQRAYGEVGIEWLARAAAEVPAADGPFAIADFGVAGGANSLRPMTAAISARREAGADGAIVVVHTDIPSNDFSAMFELLASSPNTYVGAPNVFGFAAGRSFYERIFPDRFLGLGWSSIAVHWLSAIPCPIEDHIFSSFAGGEVRDAFRARSAADWLAFLRARSAELVPGGRMIVLGGAALDDGRSEAEGLMDLALAALRELVAAGTVSEVELDRMTIPTWNRTEGEFLEPFDDAELSLEVLRREPLALDDPYYAHFRDDGDLDAYAGAVAGFFEAAFGPALWAALDPPADRVATVEAAFGECLRARIKAEPAQAACRWHVLALDLERNTDP